MKKIVASGCLIFTIMNLFAQDIEGTFKEGADSLSFSGNKAVFCISGFGGLSTTKIGEGEYEVINDFLLIHTSDYPGEKTTFQSLDSSRKDTLVIKVVSKQNYPVQGMLIEPLNRSGKSMGGRVSDNDGKVYLKKDSKMTKLSVSGMGYDDISFDCSTNNDYLVTVAQNDIIEHQTVVFRFSQIDEETASVLLLTTDFKPGKNQDRELEKLDNRAKKNNRLDKRMKKEYIPVYYPR